ncbi:cytochrome P450 4V2, partial [Caerostris extrusa]
SLTSEQKYRKELDLLLLSSSLRKRSSYLVSLYLNTSDSTQWKDRRKLFAPLLPEQHAQGYLTVFNEHSHKFVEYLMKQTENEFTSIDFPISLSTLDIVCECIMGVNIGALENESKQFVVSLHRTTNLAMSRVLKFWQWPDLLYWNSKTGKEAAYHKNVVQDFSRTVSILRCKEDSRSGQRARRRRRETAFGGRSQRSQVSGLRPEVYNVETLSRWLHVPKGASAIVMTYFLHRDEDVFPDPEKFDPERFLQENKSIPEFAYVPFGAGPRNCIGRYFGEDGGEDHGVPHIEKLHPSLSGLEGQSVAVMNITLQSSQPARIRFRPRHNNSK